MLEARLQIGMREACLVLDVSPASIHRDLKPIAAIPVVKLAVPPPRALKPACPGLPLPPRPGRVSGLCMHVLPGPGIRHGCDRATGDRPPPNQTWSCDITKLKAAGHFLCLYVILEIFSRYRGSWERCAPRPFSPSVPETVTGPRLVQDFVV